MKDRTASSRDIRNRIRPGTPIFWPFLAAVLAMSGWSHHARSANELELALGALERLDYNGAATVLRHLVDAGDPRAQAALGTLIESGTIVSDYPVPALELLRKAANQGLPEAALELGNRNYLGEEIPRDVKRAVAWWRVAATNGSAAGAFNLGLASAKGSGFPVDREAATQWFGRAAAAGSVQARFALGAIQFESAESEVELAAAFASFEAAAAAGLPIAEYNLGAMYEQGIGCEPDLTKARSWYRRAAATVDAARDSFQRLGGPSSIEDASPQTGIYTTEWVLNQSADSYTLQVATGISETAIRKVLEHHDPISARAYLRVVRDERVRYLALVGSFRSYAEAAAHLAALEPALRVHKPWVRRFESIQNLVVD